MFAAPAPPLPPLKGRSIRPSRPRRAIPAGAQEAEGGWSYSGYNEGSTALAALALLESGVKPSDPAMQRAAQFIRSRADSVTQTYSLALAIFFLDRLGDRRDAALIATLGERLRDGQSGNGGWTYFCRPGQDAGNRELPLPGAVASFGSDNSNTQFAVLGLWVARRHGVDVKRRWSGPISISAALKPPTAAGRT